MKNDGGWSEMSIFGKVCSVTFFVFFILVMLFISYAFLMVGGNTF